MEEYLNKSKIKDSIGNIIFEDNTLKIKKQIESLELSNDKLIKNLGKTDMDMLKGIIDVEKIYIYQDKMIDTIFTFKNVT